MSEVKRYRVAQWATGNIGTRALRVVIEHPQMDLVGLYVHSAEKIGRDAGDLAGTRPTGVKATNSIDDIIAAKPDCVLYMQQGIDFDDVCKLLASGANIVTTRGEFHNPARIDASIRARVEEACAAGNSSIHSTGSSPGFITEAMPLLLASMARRIDGITIDEFADVSSRDSPDTIFRIMGFGAEAGPLDAQRLAYVQHSFEHSLALIAETLGLPFDDVEVIGETAVTRQETKIAAGVLPKGTVGATRITVAGKRKGKALMRFRANWYCTPDVEPAWDLRETGWRVQVEGDTPFDLSIRFPVAAEDWAAFTPGLTAHRPVNAVPYVVAAPPGICSTDMLPHFIPILEG